MDYPSESRIPANSCISFNTEIQYSQLRVIKKKCKRTGGALKETEDFCLSVGKVQSNAATV